MPFIQVSLQMWLSNKEGEINWLYIIVCAAPHPWIGLQLLSWNLKSCKLIEGLTHNYCHRDLQHWHQHTANQLELQQTAGISEQGCSLGATAIFYLGMNQFTGMLCDLVQHWAWTQCNTLPLYCRSIRVLLEFCLCGRGYHVLYSIMREQLYTSKTIKITCINFEKAHKCESCSAYNNS